MVFPVKLIMPGQVSSTNVFLQDLVNKTEVDEGTVVLTHNQTQGKGLGRNTWESEPGKNLTFSILLKPSFLYAANQFRLNQALSLAVSDLVSELVKERPVTIKWPNDIYIGDLKVSGMLIQNTVTGEMLDCTIAGIGLNVNQEIFTSDAPNPVSLKMVTGSNYDLDQLFANICGKIYNRYLQLKNNEFQTLLGDYLSRLYRSGQWNDYVIHGIRKKAMIVGITEYGQLKLTDKAGEEFFCDLKEVVYL